MNLKISCKNPNRCSFDCLNCPYDNVKNPDYISKEMNEKAMNFKKLYNEVINDNSRSTKM